METAFYLMFFLGILILNTVRYITTCHQHINLYTKIEVTIHWREMVLGENSNWSHANVKIAVDQLKSLFNKYWKHVLQ